LALVVQLLQIRMAEQRIVVEADFGVECDNVTRSRHHQRIDLDNGAIQLGKGAVQRRQEAAERGDLTTAQTKTIGQAARQIARHARGRIDSDTYDLVWLLGGNLFDLHAAFNGSDHSHAPGYAIDQ